jgi:hypothetical protein
MPSAQSGPSVSPGSGPSLCGYQFLWVILTCAASRIDMRRLPGLSVATAQPQHVQRRQGFDVAGGHAPQIAWVRFICVSLHTLVASRT